MSSKGDVVEPLASAVEPRGLRLASLLGVRGAGRVLRDFTAYLPTQVIPAVVGFLALPLLARRLAPTELGLLAIAQTLVSAGWIVCAQWLTSAVLRELPVHREGAALASFRYTFRRGLGVTGLAFGAFAAAIALAGVVSSAVAENAWLILAAALGLIAQNIAGTLFAASIRPRAFAAMELTGRTGGILLGVKLVFDGHGVQGYLLGVGLASLVVGSISLLVGWPRGESKREDRGASLTSWLSYGGPIAVAAFAMWALLFVDRYLLALLKTTKDVGVYTVGSVVGDKAVSIPALAFYMAARPLLITAFEQRGRGEVERLMREYTRVLLLIMLPVLAFVAIASDDVVRILTNGFYARDYDPAAGVAVFIALGTVFYMLALMGGTGLIVGRRSMQLLYCGAAALVVNVAANLVLIPLFGIEGAAVATVIGMAGFLLFTQVWARRHATWRFPYGTLLRGAAATAAGTLAALALMRIADSDLARVLAGGAGGAVVYGVALALLGERRPPFIPTALNRG